MHFEILDEKRRSVLPLFSALKPHFYLAGGTALALQIGHRDSIDFDFFSETSFDTGTLFAECENIFSSHTLLKTQEESNTLGFLVDTSVAVSFMQYRYPLMHPVIESEYFHLASIADIGCMKFNAITSRSLLKDYVDLYFILKSLPLTTLLETAKLKFPMLDQNLILKSLAYFDDIQPEQIRFMEHFEVSLEEIKEFLQTTVKNEILKK